MNLRVATVDDASAIADIYRPYVEETAITVEETPPDADEIAARMETTRSQYPWFVAERGEVLRGYAYAGELRKRAAYRWAVELSVYVDRNHHSEGFGYALYDALLSTLTEQGYGSGYGVITLPNPASVSFHERFGFERVALLSNVGYKLGEWHDVAWFERELRSRRDEPSEPTPFSALDAEKTTEILRGAAAGDTE